MSDSIIINTNINDEPTEFLASERDSLLEALRDRIGLTGAKEGCNNGNCGACCVILDGRIVNACLVMAAEVEGADVQTVEGLAEGETLHPLQQAFLDHAAVQCGFCIPGMLMTLTALLEHQPTPSPGDVETALSGNTCRCTGYRQMVDAAMAAARGGQT